MSLQVWLPLNGNLNNQGLSNVTITNNGATMNDNGKIGKCYEFNGTNNKVEIGYGNGKESINFSLTAWVKPLANLNDKIIFGFNNGTNQRLYVGVKNNTYNLAFGSTTWGKTTTAPVTINTWSHLVITVDSNNKCSLYQNGKLIDEITQSSTFKYCSNLFIAGRPDGYYSNMCVNDFRIYDHCLSVKEVKEISKGLCLHYPLNDIYNCQANKYVSPYCDGYMSNTGGFTRTQLLNERGYNYKRTYTGTGNNVWMSLRVPNYSFTPGKKYYYSVKIRCNKWTGDSLTLRASRSDNDWVTNAVQVCSSSKADGQWHEYYCYQTVNETYDRSGSTVTCNPVLEFYTGGVATSGFVYDFDFDIKDVQVVESDEYMPFQEGQWNTKIVSDCSGYGNNGTIVGNIVLNNTSPRYNTSYKFTSGNKISSSTGFPIGTHPFFTLNFWFKPNSATYTTWSDIISIGANYNFRFETINSSGTSFAWWNYPLGTSGVLGNYNTTVVNTWYMITLSCDGKNFYCYRDGNLQSMVTISGTEWISTGAITLGDSGMYTNISDLRIYSTCLSADDIKELYNTPVSIDKNGNMYVYEYMEE